MALISVTHDKPNTTIQVYIDGVAQTVTYHLQEDGTSFFAWDQFLAIGAYNASGSLTGYYDGLLDEVRIYNRALTPTDIQALYTLGSGPPPSETTPPIRSNGSPIGTLPQGTTSTTEISYYK
jgi:hypothetical protein